jgi:hypothetical protein
MRRASSGERTSARGGRAGRRPRARRRDDGHRSPPGAPASRRGSRTMVRSSREARMRIRAVGCSEAMSTSGRRSALAARSTRARRSGPAVVVRETPRVADGLPPALIVLPVPRRAPRMSRRATRPAHGPAACSGLRILSSRAGGTRAGTTAGNPCRRAKDLSARRPRSEATAATRSEPAADRRCVRARACGRLAHGACQAAAPQEAATAAGASTRSGPRRRLRRSRPR